MNVCLSLCLFACSYVMKDRAKPHHRAHAINVTPEQLQQGIDEHNARLGDDNDRNKMVINKQNMITLAS